MLGVVFIARLVYGNRKYVIKCASGINESSSWAAEGPLRVKRQERGVYCLGRDVVHIECIKAGPLVYKGILTTGCRITTEEQRGSEPQICSPSSS